MEAPDPRTRYRELALLVTERSTADPAFDTAKLNDIVFVIDALAVDELGSPVTDSRYTKGADGPDSDYDLADLEDLALLDAGTRPVALRAADTSVLAAPELDLVERVLGVVVGLSAAEVKDATHNWMTSYRQAIPGERLLVDAAVR
jgi:hypothetical protein